MIISTTPDGVVIRRVWADHEDAWRVSHPDGVEQWAHCAGHKGPWLVSNKIYVPAEVLRALAECQEQAP